MPNDGNPTDIQGAFARMREIEHKLNQPVENADQAALDEQMGLIDELMTINMGLGPFRRATAQKAKDAKGAEKPDESAT